KGIELFKKEGMETDTEKKNPEELVKVIGDYDALVVRSATKVTREVLEAGGANGNLRIVGRAGVGYDNIDVAAATEFEVLVKFAPHGNTNTTAEHAFFLMGAVSRNIPQAHYSLVNGIWRKKQFEGVELYSKTLGIIGCGRIGQRLSQLVTGFSMRVVGYDENPVYVTSNFPQSGIEYISKEDVLRESDYISIHTGGKDLVIGAKEISYMKPSAIFINASRNHNVDYDALYDALKSGKLAGAGIDVHENESKEGEEFRSRFKGLDNVVLTSHLGASTKEASEKTSIEMADVVIGYLLRGNLINAINEKELYAPKK
ncbi:MAG: hydroxyacid dehydrogenase, partial [Candidatus Thorarchaeota archaeon]